MSSLLIKRLKPYGPVLPHRLSRPHLTAWVLGIRDGWNQPRCVSSSYNVDHLVAKAEDWDVTDTLDRGINLGQWLRSPLNHEQYEG